MEGTIIIGLLALFIVLWALTPTEKPRLDPAANQHKPKVVRRKAFRNSSRGPGAATVNAWLNRGQKMPTHVFNRLEHERKVENTLLREEGYFHNSYYR